MSDKNELQVIVAESGLEPSKAQVMLDKFSEYFKLAAEWEQKAKTIVVTDESQVTEMKMARVGRLMLKEKRVELEKTRKSLKEQALREGKAIDGIANALKAVIVPIEEDLYNKEHFVEHKRAAEEEVRRIEADRLLAEKEEADRQAEAKRLAEQEAENVRLKAEAELQEKARAAERAEAAKKLTDQQAAAHKERQKVDAAKARAKAAADAKTARIREAADFELADQRAQAEEKAAADRKAADAAREKAIKDEQERAAKEREEVEAKHAEDMRLASMVTCPLCGHEFSTEDV